MEYLGFVILLALAVALLAANIRIVPQAHAYVIERLGAYQATWSVGVHVKVPLIDRVVKKISLKEQVIDFPPQPVITKDNVTMQIDTVIFFQITDPKLYTYGVERPISAIDYLTQTTLRNIIGDLELDETLTSREVINTKMRVILDEATDPWGIKINRVEVKNILPPKEIQNAMEKQMKAEREKREAILIAEGQKSSAILVAQGNRESMILQAEAEKQSAILRAEAKKEASNTPVLSSKPATSAIFLIMFPSMIKFCPNLLLNLKPYLSSMSIITLGEYSFISSINPLICLNDGLFQFFPRYAERIEPF
jgi:regulator of protease activity HflC (stomatin/prohibitin superfamily)